MIELQLKVKHFKGATHMKKGECPISFALNEHFNTTGCFDAITKCTVIREGNKQHYSHQPYSIPIYMEDILKINASRPDDFIVRTIQLIPL